MAFGDSIALSLHLQPCTRIEHGPCLHLLEYLCHLRTNPHFEVSKNSRASAEACLSSSPFLRSDDFLNVLREYSHSKVSTAQHVRFVRLTCTDATAAVLTTSRVRLSRVLSACR